MNWELKLLDPAGVDAALTKADRYRNLNQPEEAESICQDVLAVAPDHQRALVIMGLSLTDLFKTDWLRAFDLAIAAFRRLENEYERVYYTAVAWERYAKAQLEHGSSYNAAHAFEHALALFEEAEGLAPRGDPDPILRWNRCVRAIRTHADVAEAMHAPREENVLGD